MYIYQNGKLYTQLVNKLIGVDVYSDKVLKVENTETEQVENCRIMDKYEVTIAFNIENEPYIFPRKEEVKTSVRTEKEVVEDVATNKTKRTYRKSTGK